MARKRTRKITSHGYRSASDFIRHQPVDTPAKDVVEAGAKLGIALNAGLVRVTRFKMRQEGGNRATAAGRRPRKRTTRGASSEILFLRLVAEVGTARARELVAKMGRAFERHSV
jgi:hypothetical protein